MTACNVEFMKKTIGQKLLELRKRHNLSRREVGEVMGGISAQMVYKFEHDLSCPTVDKVQALLEKIEGATLSEIFDAKEQPQEAGQSDEGMPQSHPFAPTISKALAVLRSGTTHAESLRMSIDSAYECIESSKMIRALKKEIDSMRSDIRELQTFPAAPPGGKATPRGHLMKKPHR
jgi:transcriptional regulator with XRE-family HTH domain